MVADSGTVWCVVTARRLREYETLRQRIVAWAHRQDDVDAVLIVGSWARGLARTDSDVDIVVLTRDVARYVADEHWIADAVGAPAPVVRTQRWGELVERRVRLSSGLEIEFGFVAPSWATTDPVDPGTAAVVRDGAQSLYDPLGLIETLTAAAFRTGP